MPVTDLREVLVYLEQGQPGEAIPLLERLTRERPAHVTVHLLLARAYEQVGRAEAARALWQAARFLMPNSPVVLEGLRRSATGTPTPQQSGARSETEDAVPAPAKEVAPAAPDAPSEAPPPAAPPQAEAPPESDNPEVEQAAPAPAVSSAPASPAEPEEQHQNEPPHEPTQRPRPMTTDDLLASLQRQQPGEADGGDDDDLQRLIDELEAARIEPSPDLDEIPPPELDHDIEDMVSETLARIYVAQGQHREAAKVYVQLAHQHPDRADEFTQRAEELRQQAAEEEE